MTISFAMSTAAWKEQHLYVMMRLQNMRNLVHNAIKVIVTGWPHTVQDVSKGTESSCGW